MTEHRRNETGANVGAVQLSIERNGGNKYTVKSDQLEYIGSQLRGKRHFSIFNSIVLPVIVAILTTLFTGGFQYISWINSVRVQNATDILTRATEAYEATGAALSKRRQTTFLFMPTVQTLAGIPDPTTTGTSGAGFTLAQAPDANRITLANLDLQLHKHRFETFYSQLKAWNESYDQLLTSIEYNLDRPALIRAAQKVTRVRIFLEQLKDFNCASSLTKEFTRLNLMPHSLKNQLGAIQICYMRLTSDIGAIKQAASGIDSNSLSKPRIQLGELYMLENEFRCYAQQRIDYYRGLKERAIISPRSIWRDYVQHAERAIALDHFTTSAERCDPPIEGKTAAR